MRRALEISMQGDDTKSTNTATAVTNNSFLDPAFINELLGSVDVDQNDPLIQAALAQMGVLPSAKSDDASPDSKKRKGEDEDKK